MNLTRPQLRACVPRAPENTLDACLDGIILTCIRFNINTPARLAAFLAQIAHESMSFNHMAEIWEPTPTQMRYSNRADLGNTLPEARRIAKARGTSTGYLYRARGPLGITGYANYLACGRYLGLDLVNYPELLDNIANGMQAAGWFWHTRRLNRLADEGLFETITRRVNGKLNGYADRLIHYKRIKGVLGVN